MRAEESGWSIPRGAKSPASRMLLRHYAKFLVFATLVLIFLGGQVKSNDAGLAVPDWPLTYGENPITFPIDRWVGNIFHEHFHRLVAGTVGVLTLIMTGWVLLAENRRWVKTLACVALAAVIGQAILGGLTVIYLLPTAISVSHGVLAQAFFVLTIILAYSQSKERAHRSENESAFDHTPLRPLAFALFAVVFVQLILGAIMRHTESGLAIPDFPTTAGNALPVISEQSLEWVNARRAELSWEMAAELPPVSMAQVALHYAHRMFGYGIGLLALGTLWWMMNGHRHTRGAGTVFALVALVVVQIALGAASVLTLRAATVASLHVATGAAILGVATLFVLRTNALSLTPVRTAVEEKTPERSDFNPVST